MGGGPGRIGIRARYSESFKAETPNKSGGFEADHRGNQKTVETSAGCCKGDKGGEEEGNVRQRVQQRSSQPSVFLCYALTWKERIGACKGGR